MSSVYQISRITNRQIDPAYVLAQAMVPMLDLETWRIFCRFVLNGQDHQDERDEILVATNPPGYVQGLAICAVRQHPVYGRIVDVSVFVVASVGDDAGVAALLLDRLKALARTEGCKGLRVWTWGQDPWSRALDDSEVHRFDGVLMVDPAPL